jgi:cytidylate kinase
VTAAPPRTVTISATYGAGATIVAPTVAARLGLPYLERIVSPETAGTAARAGRESLAGDERPEGLLRRLVDALAHMPGVVGTTIPEPAEGVSNEERVRASVEATLHEVAETTGAVVVGRGGMVVLGSYPTAFHVRLDGPAAARRRQGMAIEEIDEAVAKRRQGDTDRARAMYLRRFYDVSAADAGLYHLVLDSTAIPLDGCVDVIVAAAEAFWAAPR